MENLDKIINYFEPGKTPTYEEFRKSWTSFRHKAEKQDIPSIIGLNDALENMATKEELANMTTNFKGYYTSIEKLREAHPRTDNKKE